MTRTRKLLRTHFASLLLALFLGVFAVPQAYSGTCAEGRGMPPFLGSEVVTPNVMLMIDNSASMYDLAYLQDVGQCTDDSESYEGSQTAGVYDTPYAGYFHQSSWYYYDEYTDADTVDDQFIETDAATAVAFCNNVNNATDTKYFGPDSTTPYICVSTDQTTTPGKINAFAATGHFLNWAATSKMDIQKLVLTGGKYDDDTDQLIMESRGCVGRTLVKEVALQNASGDDYKLSLGLTAETATGGNTLIEIYEISELDDEEPYISDACQNAIDYLTLSGDSVKLGTLFRYLDECLQNPSNDPVVADSNAAINQSLHSCWYLATKGREAWEQTAVGDVTRIANSCQKIYEADPPVSPTSIMPEDSGYICAGDHEEKTDYIGRCWVPLSSAGYLDRDESEETLFAADSGEDQLLGYVPETGSQRLPGSHPAQRTNQQASKYEQVKVKLISSLKSFMDGAGSRTAERAGVIKAFLNFIVAEAEAAVGNIFVVNNPTSSSNNFKESDATNELGGSSLRARLSGNWAEWRKNLLENGVYEVAVYYACEGETPDPEALYTVTDTSGNHPYPNVDQTTGCGDWHVLGEHVFSPEEPAIVRVEYIGSNNQYNINADGVRFTVVESYCGNAEIDAGEECDDGGETETCDNDCTLVECGDGTLNLTALEECDDGNTTDGDGCEANCIPYLPPPTEGDWTANGYDYEYLDGGADGISTIEDCRLQALYDFCNWVNEPPVIDPSDQSSLGSTGDYWNIPAILTDMALKIQKGDPIFTMKGRVKATKPSGVIQEHANDVRLGIMKFNDLGDHSECNVANDNVGLFPNCEANASTSDGAVVAVPIDMWDGKLDPTKTIDFVVGEINAIKGTTWTPLAEAMYTVNGYFGERGFNSATEADYRLNTSDYMVTPYAPVWDDSVDYAPGSIVMYNNGYYQTASGGISNDSGTTGTDIPDAGITDWQPITVDSDMREVWNNTTDYDLGDIVLNNNKYYLAKTDPGAGATEPQLDNNGSNWVQISGPIYASCQSNNLIIITEGSSTADLNLEMLKFVSTHNDGADADSTTIDLEEPENNQCDSLKGSTYFDDLTYYGQHASDMYAIEPYGEYGDGGGLKNNIQTHIVYTGASRTGPPGECSPEQFLKAAATNADPKGAADALNYGEDEQKLRNSLEELFRSILTRTSSGSAASVISASRGGEGALYQAIFWPDKDTHLTGASGEPIFTKWTGEVHSFLVDTKGILYLDNYPTGGNGALDLPIDTDNDGSMDTFRDQPIIAFFDESQDPAQTVGCPGTIELNDPADITDDEIVFLDDSGACLVPVRPLDELEYLWSTSDWLNSNAMDSNIEYNRAVNASEFDFTGLTNKDKRYIFTWNDLDNDGVVDRTPVDEVRPFVDNLGGSGLPTVTVGDRGPVPLDFGVNPGDTDAETQVNNIIKWVRGKNSETFADPENWRIRQVPGDITGDGVYRDVNGNPNEWVTWKLGDVIHSTPISVAAPAENYHQLYRDYTYAEFLARWQERRHMVYFGANDGMLHAVNGGFFKTIYNPVDPTEKQSRFCLTKDCQFDNSGVEIGSGAAPVLGTEMWAYVPYNLIPHLKCLTEPGYVHKYYVDLRPRIFDVQIFEPEPECGTSDAPTPLEPGCVHPNGWGTILVGGMRFGGSKVRPCCLDNDSVPGVDYPGYDYDNREFTSAYFLLDITNPEKPPALLGEFTRTIDNSIVDDLNGDGVPDESDEVELGYTTVISTVVPMKVAAEDGVDKNCHNGSGEPEISKWYLVLGSGPTSLDGTSTQKGSLGIVPLDRLVDTDGAGSGDAVLDMRIPKNPPTVASEEFGSFMLPNSDSFTSDLITVDIEIQKDYLADVVYFGTNTGNWGNWGGMLNRLVVRDWVSCNGKQIQIETKPNQWASLFLPDTTPFMPLIDVEQPITAAPTVATDGLDYWVYFGTGRFFDADDKIDLSSNATQSFYGIREPRSIGAGDLNLNSLSAMAAPDACQLTWSQVLNNRLTPSTGGHKQDGTILADEHRAKLGLLQVDQIEILSTELLDQDKTLACIGGGTSCLPSSLVYTSLEAADIEGIDAGDTKSFSDLVDYITGDSFNCVGTNPGLDGWYRDFHDSRERNLGQASLLGGLASYTSYRPFSDACQDEGLGNLYGVYYLTGTAWIKDVFGIVDVASNPRAANTVKISLGKGLSTTPNIHVGQEEGGKAFVQTSVGKIVEIPQPFLPSKDFKTGRVKWRDIEQ